MKVKSTPEMRPWPLEYGFLIVILIWTCAGSAWAQLPVTALPAAKENEVAAPEVIAVADVIPSSARTLARLRGIRSKLDADDTIRIVAARLPGVASQLDEWWKLEKDTIQELRSVPRLNDVLWQWRLFEAQVTNWNATLATKSRGWIAEEATLDRLIENWQATQSALEPTAPPAVRNKIRDVLTEGATAHELFQEKTKQLVSVQAKLAERLDRLNEIRLEIEAARQSLSGDLLVIDSPPLWTALFAREPIRSIAAQTLASSAKLYREAVNFFQRYRKRVLAHIAMFLLLALVFTGLRRLSRNAGEVTFTVAERVVIERSLASALLTTLLCAPLLYSGASPQIVRMMAIPTAIPMLMLLPAIFTSRFRIGLYFLTVVFLLDFWRYSLPPHLLLVRLLLLSEAILGILGVGLMATAEKATLPSSYLAGVIRLLLKTTMALFVGVVIANVVGNLTLAEVLLSPLVRTLYLSVLIQLGAAIATAFTLTALGTPIAKLSRTVQNREAAVASCVRRLASLVAIGLCVAVGMYNVGMLENAKRMLAGLWELKWKVGAAEILARDFAVFILVFGSAYVLSRWLRFLLTEEIFPRFRLPRGVPDALELLSRYGVLLFGLVFALTSAGVSLSQVALAIGALGVGIGFGLQNIVNNFVCGLILVFEHPIQVGDLVEVGPHYGQVRNIGFRASLVRTLDGALVIIPNAELIGSRVTNWSLSNGFRRITVRVPVPIGTDPRRVIDILETVARNHAEVAASPAPRAALEAFGESALKFILDCWTRSEGFGLVIQALSLSIDNALQKAGIQIPYPQTDVHVHWTPKVKPEIPLAEKLG
jgi:small-conductance mechanosensitive channel